MSLTDPYDPDNVFAKILRNEMPAFVIAESERTVAIMDAFPQSRGHCLVIPKAASRNLLEMARKDLSAVTDQTQRVARAVQRALQPDGIVITQFNGAAAGQTVFHTHVHIIPRYSGQALADHASEPGDTQALDRLALHIRSHLE